MKWKGREGSGNIDDRRGDSSSSSSGGRGAGGLLLMLFSRASWKIKLFMVAGGLILVFVTGINPLNFLGSGGDTAISSPNETTGVKTTGRSDDEMAQFIQVVLKDTEDVWEKVFREQLNSTYKKPIMVMFSGSTSSACGYASASTGPFYCPADQKVYVDLSFYNELVNKFGGGGDFAMAYVIAHEVGHHVQNLLGISDKVHAAKGKVSEAEYNQLSVKLELQADFLAGVWANKDQSMNNILEEGDIQEAMNAANAIGDDRLQKQARGYAQPDSFTHGTSEQRMKWFMKGYKTGDISQGDTFSATDL
ncbi:MAG: neutral zinc metallopeptidase [Flavobacteriales bacterium]|nr:neutral zinc metallopeptidase [Flavobacteriales bacterium]